MGRDRLEHTGLDWIILKQILEKRGGSLWTGSGQGPVAASNKYGDQVSSSIKDEEFE